MVSVRKSLQPVSYPERNSITRWCSCFLISKIISTLGRTNGISNLINIDSERTEAQTITMFIRQLLQERYHHLLESGELTMDVKLESAAATLCGQDVEAHDQELLGKKISFSVPDIVSKLSLIPIESRHTWLSNIVEMVALWGVGVQNVAPFLSTCF